MRQFGKGPRIDGRHGMAFAAGGQQPGNTRQVSNMSSTTGPLPAIADKLGSLVESLWGWGQQHPQAPAFFPGPTVAPYSDRTRQALSALYQRGSAGAPLADAAGRSIGATLNGDWLDPGRNPYFQKALAAGLAPARQSFVDSVLPAVQSTFAGAGRTGSGADRAMTERALDSFNRATADATVQAAAGAFDQERGRQMVAADLVPALAGQDYADLSAMLMAGGAEDQKAQQQIDAAREKYDYEQTAEPLWMALKGNLLQGLMPGSQTTGSASSWGRTMPSVNPLAMAMSGLQSLGPLAAGFASLSDRDAKTDIEKLGRDPLSGLPVYAYRYRGDPKTYPKVVGPMAQDVARRFPDRVRRIAGRRVVTGAPS